MYDTQSAFKPLYFKGFKAHSNIVLHKSSKSNSASFNPGNLIMMGFLTHFVVRIFSCCLVGFSGNCFGTDNNSLPSDTNHGKQRTASSNTFQRMFPSGNAPILHLTQCYYKDFLLSMIFFLVTT